MGGGGSIPGSLGPGPGRKRRLAGSIKEWDGAAELGATRWLRGSWREGEHGGLDANGEWGEPRDLLWAEGSSLTASKDHSGGGGRSGRRPTFWKSD